MDGPFWKRVHRRAVREALQNLNLESRERVLLAALSATLVIAALLFWGSEHAGRDELIARGALVLLVFLLFPILYAFRFCSIPSSMDRELRQRISILEEASIPSLALTFLPQPPFVETETVQHLNYERPRYKYSVLVTNTSTSNSIRNVEVQLRIILGYNEPYHECSLLPLNGETPFDLAPQQSKYIQVAHWLENAKPGTRRRLPDDRLKPGVSGYSFLDVEFDARGRERIHPIRMYLKREDRLTLPFGRYVFVLTAYGENVPAVSKRFLVGHFARWRFGFQELEEPQAELNSPSIEHVLDYGILYSWQRVKPLPRNKKAPKSQHRGRAPGSPRG